MDGAYLLKTHVQGIINHGKSKTFTYVDYGQYKHDPNMVIGTILKVLDKSKNEDGILPRTLYLQADNCFRENKNKHVLSFCELLVTKNIFNEVHLSFLYVGHTHEDIDAEFSRIAEKLRKMDAATMIRLLDLLPNSEELNGLYDVKGWLSPFIANIQHHSKPLHFRFMKTASGTELSTKARCDSEWLPVIESLLPTIPPGIPEILLPEVIDKLDLQLLNASIRKCSYLFRDRSSENWWVNFIESVKKVQTHQASKFEYACRGARWILNELPTQQEQPLAQIQIPPSIQEMLDKELDDAEITVRRRTIRGQESRTRGGGRGARRGQTRGRRSAQQ